MLERKPPLSLLALSEPEQKHALRLAQADPTDARQTEANQLLE